MKASLGADADIVILASKKRFKEFYIGGGLASILDDFGPRE